MPKYLFKVSLFFFFLSLSGTTLANQKLTLVLDWFVNTNHAPIFIAKEKGFFNKNGLEVEIITPSDPNDPPKWVASGKADIALDYQLHAIMESGRELPIIQIGTLIDKPLNCLVVLESSHIDKISDLKGKAIAYSAPEIDLLILKTMLEKEKLSLKDVTPINVHYDLTQALLTKKVAGAIGMMRNVELFQLKLLGKPGKVFLPENYGVPSYSELVFIANKKHFKDEKYNRFFKAMDEALVHLKQHSEEDWKSFVIHHPELDTPLNKEVWLNSLDNFPNKFQSLDKLKCEKVVSFLSDKLNMIIKREVCALP